MPLWHCAHLGRYEMAEMLLRHGADPNGRVYASGSPAFSAYGQGDAKMIELMRSHGGVLGAIPAGLYGETELAAEMLAGRVDPHLDEGHFAGETVAEQLLWGAVCGGAEAITRMALREVEWPRDDPRWYRILEQPLRMWTYGKRPVDRSTYLTCFRLVLERADANVRGRFGRTLLHDIVAFRERMTTDEAIAFATMLLDRGAQLDVRDDLLASTPLGWACRWGHRDLAELFIAHGADVVEADAEPWATPRAWALKMGHGSIP
jgi:ankyrin repeat protein